MEDAVFGVLDTARLEGAEPTRPAVAGVAAAAADRLLSVALSLRDAATVYHRWSTPIGHHYDRDIAGEHQALVDAVIARDADAASRLLAQHIDRTSASLRAVTHSETEHAG
ncbi:FCD domain-containing protein [Streptomyces sp. NPDC003442]